MAHRSSLTLLSFTRTTNNSIRTRHHWEFLHMMMRLKHPSPSCFTETETDCIRRVKEAATHWQHHAKKFPLSLQFLQWEERARADKQPCPDPSTVGHFVRTTMLILPHEDTRESVVLNHWESDCERKGGEGATKPAHGLCQTEFISAVKVVILTSISAYLQNQVRDAFWQGNLAEYKYDWSGSSNKEFCWPLHPVCPHPDKELNASLSWCGECFLAPFDQKVWW